MTKTIKSEISLPRRPASSKFSIEDEYLKQRETSLAKTTGILSNLEASESKIVKTNQQKNNISRKYSLQHLQYYKSNQDGI